MAGRKGQLTRPGCIHGSLGCGRSYVAVALMSGRRYVGRPYVSRPYVGRSYVGRPIVLVPVGPVAWFDDYFNEEGAVQPVV